MSDFNDVFREIIEKIGQRDNLYEQTWRQIPIADLIAVARVKTFRATTMLNKKITGKLLDDLVFAIERIKEGDLK